MALYPNLKAWHILNQDTGQVLSGQFEPDTVDEARGSVYAERFALNRKKGVLQFLHGKTPTVQFTGLYFNETALGPLPTLGNVKFNLDTLKSWTERDSNLGRPPIVTFWIGDSWISIDAVIEDVAIQYLKPGFLGAFKGARYSVSLREYTPFSINDTANYDTRYHKAKSQEYYELIANREYKRPMLGVVLRQRAPTKMNLKTGDVVKLPSGTGTIRTAAVTQQSVAFSTAFDIARELSPQALRHKAMVDARNKTKISHILVI